MSLIHTWRINNVSRKPPGYWDDWKNVEETLRPVIARLGRFPTIPELKDLSLDGLIKGTSSTLLIHVFLQVAWKRGDDFNFVFC